MEEEVDVTSDTASPAVEIPAVESSEVPELTNPPQLELPRTLVGFPDIKTIYYQYTDKGLNQDQAARATAADVFMSATGEPDAAVAAEVVTRAGANNILVRYTDAEDSTTVGAFLESATRTFVPERTGLGAGVTAGIKGAKVTPGGPFLKGAVGLTAGLATYLGVSETTDALIRKFFPKSQPLPEDFRAETVGETVGLFGAGIKPGIKLMSQIEGKPFDEVAGRLLNNQSNNIYVQRFMTRSGQILDKFGGGLQSIGQTARTAPKTLIPAELQATTYAGVGAYGAETLFPGETLPRVASEIILPIVSPHRAVANGVGHFAPDVIDKIKTTISRNPEYKNNKNALALVESLDRLGEMYQYLTPDALKQYGQSLKIQNRAGQDVDFGNLVDQFTVEGRFLGKPFFDHIDEGNYQDLDGNTITSDLVIQESGAISGYNADDVLASLNEFELLGPDGAPIQDIEVFLSSMVDSPEIRQMLRVMEGAYLKRGSAATEEAINKNRESLGKISTVIQALAQVKTPEALQLAEQLRSERMKMMLSGMLDARLTRAINAANNATGPPGAQARLEIGEQILKGYEELVTTWRTLESAAYDKALNNQIPIGTRNLRQQWQRIKMGEGGVNEEVLGTYFSDDIIKNLNRSAGLGEKIPEGELVLPEDSLNRLQNLRSDLLERARKELAAGGSKAAGLYGKLAAAVLDDITVSADDIARRAAENPDIEISNSEQALLEAHRISRAGNDVFTRGATKMMGRKTAEGDYRLPPEFLVSELKKGSADKTYRLFTGLKAANEKVAELQGLDISDSTHSLISVYDKALRNLLNKVVVERTFIGPNGQELKRKVVDQRAVQRELDPDSPLGALLQGEEFSALRADLMEADSAASLIEAYQNPRWPALVEKRASRSALLGRTFDIDNPSDLVRDALSNKQNPVSSFETVMKRVNSLEGRASVAGRGVSKETVREAFVGSVFDWAFAGSLQDGVIRPKVLFEKLYNPVAPNKPSVIQMMQNKDFIDAGTSGRLKVLLQRMTEVEDVVAAGRIDEVLDSDSPVTQFALRLLGAQAAGQVSRATGVGTIQVPAAGAQLALSLFSKMPRTFSIEFMRELVQPGNKALFEKTLRRGIELRNEKAAKEVYDGLSGLMIQVLGFNPRIALPVLRETKEAIMDEPGTMEVRTERIPTAGEIRQTQQQASRKEFVETQNRLAAERQAQPPPPQPQPAPAAAPPQASIAPQSNTQSLQRAVQVLGMDDEIGGLASEMLMRQRPS